MSGVLCLHTYCGSEGIELKRCMQSLLNLISFFSVFVLGGVAWDLQWRFSPHLGSMHAEVLKGSNAPTEPSEFVS